MAAVIVAASGVPETTGLPLCATVDDAALKFGTAQSEREKLRRKRTGALILMAWERRSRSRLAARRSILPTNTGYGAIFGNGKTVTALATTPVPRATLLG